MLRLPRKRVHIPAKTSRNQDVPEYEAEILRRLWTTTERKVQIGDVPTDVPVNERYIDIPNPTSEYQRIREKYKSASAPGKTTSLVTDLWPTTDDFVSMFTDLIEKAADTDMYVGDITPVINVPQELLEAQFDGMTQKVAEDLAKLGITGIRDMAKRSVMDLCAAHAVTPTLAKSLIAQAQAKLDAATLVGSTNLD